MWLCSVLTEYEDELEASLAFSCSQDRDQLDAFWSGSMSFRRLFVLASQLPDDSPLRRKILGPEEYQWSAELRMLASIHEQVQWVGWVMGQLQSHRFKGKKNPIPEPQIIPRPGVSPAEIKANAKRQAKPGGLVFGAKARTVEESKQNKAQLRGFFGDEGRKKTNGR